jgi:ADP-glucose pyrophosphorylase
VYIGDGVRVKDAILLEGTTIERNAAVLNSIVGRDCTIGPWARVDGEEETEADAASGQGKKISVTVLASDVSLAAETLVRSCIVLPNVSTFENKERMLSSASSVRPSMRMRRRPDAVRAKRQADGVEIAQQECLAPGPALIAPALRRTKE